MNEEQRRQSADGSIDADDRISIKKRVHNRLVAAWALFFFGVPAAFFGCAATFDTGAGFLLPIVLSIANLAVVVSWFRERSRLPAAERTVLPVVFMVPLVLTLIGFSLLALAFSDLK